MKYLLGLVFAVLSAGEIHAQVMVEKDLLFTEFPPYNGLLMNELIENNFTQDFIKSHRVKTLICLTQYSDNKTDTVLPLHKVDYDTLGRISQRAIFYYGGLYKTEFFSYSGNKMTVYNKGLSNKNQERLSYVVFYDERKNPVKFVNYDADNHPDGLDSIIFSYTYDKKGVMQSKREVLYYDEDEPKTVKFSFKYNRKGQNTGYLASNDVKQTYSVVKKYEGNFLVEKAGRFVLFPTTDLKPHKEQFFDSTSYYYRADSSLGIIKKDYLYDPLMSSASQEVIQLEYGDNGFLKEKFDPAAPQKDHFYYRWEFYEH